MNLHEIQKDYRSPAEVEDLRDKALCFSIPPPLLSSPLPAMLEGAHTIFPTDVGYFKCILNRNPNDTHFKAWRSNMASMWSFQRAAMKPTLKVRESNSAIRSIDSQSV